MTPSASYFNPVDGMSHDPIDVDLSDLECPDGQPNFSEAQRSFESLSVERKFERLTQLVRQSQVYSQIMLDNMMERTFNKKREREREEHERESSTPNDVTKTPSTPHEVIIVDEGIEPEIISVRHSSRLAKQSQPQEFMRKGRKKNRPILTSKSNSKETFSTSEVSSATLQTKKAIEAAQTGHNQQQPSIISGCVMKEYQLDGLEWLVSLYENGLNGILADEMGLGKTLQCIALYGYLIEHGVKGPFLVVAPLSTVANWCEEFKRFSPTIKVLQYVGNRERRAGIKLKSKNSASVVVTSYEIMIRDYSKLSRIKWGYLTVDEGHRLKNFQSILVRYLKKLRVGNRLLLTGTPLQNNLKELWSLLNFILPEIFHDLELFESWFNFEEVNNLKDEIEEKERKMVMEKIQTEFVKHLHTILQPFMLRRLKSDVIKDLPPKKEYILYTNLTPMQKLFYRGALDGDLPNTILQLYLKEYLLQNHSDVVFDEKGLDVVDVMLRKRTGDDSVRKRRRVVYYGDEISDNELSDRKTLSVSDNNYEIPFDPYQPSGVNEVNVPFANAILCETQNDGSSELKGPCTASPHSGYDPGKYFREEWNGRVINEAELKYADDSEATRGDLNDPDPVDVIEVSDTELSSEEIRESTITRALRTIERHVKNLHLQNTMMQLRNVCATHYTYYEPFPLDRTNDSQYDEKFARLIFENSGKVQMLQQITKRLLADKHKILIFSQFTKVLDLIALHYQIEGINCSRLDGRMDQELRTDEINAFSGHGEDSTRIFLLSTRAGGLGLNLIHADTVILFDNDWNPQMDLQAIDRVHRIGQTKPVKIIRLVVRDTIEELLIMKSFNKRALEKLVIESGHFQLSRMAQKLVADNIDISAMDSFKSVLALGNRMHVHESGASNFNDLSVNAVLMGNIKSEPRGLTTEEMDELMDRSLDCYKREPREFVNMTSFETTNNFDVGNSPC